MRGKFITFEGLDGAGKSSHIGTVVSLLEGLGRTVASTREPGGTPVGEKLRTLLLGDEMDLETETLLMFAARREHLAKRIRPALDRGDWVVCDRFSDATFAYQGGGRGVSMTRIEQLEQWVHGDLQPDLTLLFDLPYAVARERIGNARALDRFEQEQADFHERVRAAYRLRAERFPQRIRVIDARGDLPSIKRMVEKTVLTIC